MTSNFNMVQEFHEAMGVKKEIWEPSQSLIDLRLNLIDEELTELTKEFYTGYLDFNETPQPNTLLDYFNKKQVAKELADLLYVVYGTADSFGIDIDRVFAEVHRSNMSKLVDGKPLKREDGKVLKGPNYTPPNLDFIDNG